MPRLVVLSGPDAGRRFELTGPVVTVGRQAGNVVHLHDPEVSRRHLEVRATPSGYQLVDLGSGNGTAVNGTVVRTHDLAAGDRVRLGGTEVEFVADRPADRVSVSSAPAADLKSAILRTVPEDAGSRLFADPGRAPGDWLRGRLANLTVLYAAANAVSDILDVDVLLARILELILPVTDADHGCFLLTDPDSGELMPRAVRSRTGGQEVVVSRTVAEHVLRERQGVLAADPEADARFAGGESLARHRIRELICVPVRGRHATLGVLFLDRGAGGSFTSDHLHLAVAVAHQAALAVEDTRHYQALLAAEKLAAVGQTIAALSHHIKNVMQGVRFGGDMVRTGLGADDYELARKGWKLVETNQRKIDDLILDMLSYSKDREPAVEPTDLGRLAADVLDVVRGRAAAAGVELSAIVATPLPPVPCDPDGLHRALLNVVSNAVDAVEGTDSPRVTVELRLTADGSWAEVAVIDTGDGVPADKVDDIFKPFVSSKGSRGTGLGLPVSRKVLREHGGDLVVTPGPGGRFVLRLPMNRAD